LHRLSESKAASLFTIAARLFIAIPIIGLAAGALAWLQYGIDLPFDDDWREYVQGRSGSFNLGFLFIAVNSTYYPVGKMLDAIAQRCLDGNSVAYQFLSMIFVLGSLLVLQWRLLCLVMKDRLLAACAFSLTVFMLQPGSYWGLQNLAYHQAVPLLCIIAILALVVGSGLSRKWLMPTVALLGLIAGLTYTSGSIPAIAAAIVLLAFAPFVDRESRYRLISGGGALLVTGIATTILQLQPVFDYAPTAEASGSPLTWPNDSVFWAYALGKVARSASLQDLPVSFAFALSLALSAAVAVVFGLFVWRTLRGRVRTLEEARLPIIYVTLAVVVFVYLCMVAAARARVHAPERTDSIFFFVAGFRRFHFFWITVLWPWLAAASFSFAAQARSQTFSVRFKALALTAPILIVAAAFGGVFDYFAYHRGNNLRRARMEIPCLQESLLQGHGIKCDVRNPSNIATGYAHALSINASFTRLFQFPRVKLGDANPAPLFRLSTVVPDRLHVQGAVKAERTAAGFVIEPQVSSIQFNLESATPLDACVVAEVAVSATQPSKLSYQVLEQKKIMRARKPRSPASLKSESPFKEKIFQVSSVSGFKNQFQLEFDGSQVPILVKDIELRCRLWLN
jgi:hypothetical protein